MFGISKSNIIEEGEDGKTSRNSNGPQVVISRNQTNPNMIVDGVNSIDISRESSDRFYVHYYGFTSGSLWVTADGIRELKETFLDDQKEIPNWTVSTDLPDWFPTPEWTPSPVTCEECGSDVPVTQVVTPFLSGIEDRYCRDCWYSIRKGL
jgi:hypothetical protein